MLLRSRVVWGVFAFVKDGGRHTLPRSTTLPKNGEHPSPTSAFKHHCNPTCLHVSIGRFHPCDPCTKTSNETETHCLPEFYMMFLNGCRLLMLLSCSSHANSQNQVRGHSTGSSHSGTEEQHSKNTDEIKVIHINSQVWLL